MIVSSLVFGNNTILSCFLFFFVYFLDNIYLLLPEVIEQIFNPTTEIIIPTGTAPNEANAENKTKPLIAESKQENIQSN